MQGGTVEIPIAYLALLAFVIVVIAISYLPLSSFTGKPPPFETLQRRLGLSRLNSGFAFLLLLICVAIFLFWAALFVSLSGGLLDLIGKIITDPPPTDDTLWDWRFDLAKLTALTGVLAAVVALPFTIIRLKLNRDQNRHAEEALYNEKMNTAVADLHALRQVTKWRKNEDGTEIAENGWEDDIHRRIAAMDRVKGLVEENRALQPRVDQMLSIYLREMTREHPPLEFPDKATNEEVVEFFRTARKNIRSDMQYAVQILSQLPRPVRGANDRYLPDLQNINMQALRLSELSLNGATLSWAKLQGAQLIGSQLKSSDLSMARMQRANMCDSDLSGANLYNTYLQGANLSRANLQGANLSEVEAAGANFHNSNLQYVDFWDGNLSLSNFSAAKLQNARLHETRLQGTKLVIAELQGTDFFRAKLQGADLSSAKFDKHTNFAQANLRGAAISNVSLNYAPRLEEQLDHLFGDSTVSFPVGMKVPDRFKVTYGSKRDFHNAWRDFQRAIGQDPDNPE